MDRMTPAWKIERAAYLLLVLAIGAWAAWPVHATSPVEQVIEAACQKKVVALGELPSHGEARAFEAKAAIVRGLVERCGFDAVLFEAPFYEFEFLSKQEHVAANFDGLDQAIGRLWAVDQLKNWRIWLAGRVARTRLYVGGLDDQPSATSDLTRQRLPGLISNASSETIQTGCKETVSRHLDWAYDAEYPFDDNEKTRLHACAATADSVFALVAPLKVESALTHAFLNYAKRQAGIATAVTRDQSMRGAFDWHWRRLPTGRRVVIWTATVHAARAQGARPYMPLGATLADEFGDDYFAVGFTALKGTSALSGENPADLQPVPSDSLEALALSDGVDSTYLDRDALASYGRAPSRLYGAVASHMWSRHFDAVVVYRNEIAPTASVHP